MNLHDHEMFSSWELIFLPASDPPDEDTIVLASDGNEVEPAYLSEGNWFKAGSVEYWPGVIGWADLPDPQECIKDLIKI